MHSYPQAGRKPNNINLAWITLGFLENKRYLVGLENTGLPTVIKTNLKPTNRVSWSQKNQEVQRTLGKLDKWRNWP